MSNSDRLQTLLDSLGMEIVTAQAGSNQGQFPILDLLGNLRDQAEGRPGLTETHRRCAEAWERMVRIVESGQSFTAEEIQWLNDLLTFLQKAVRSGEQAPTAAPAPAAAPAAPETPKAAPAPAKTEAAPAPVAAVTEDPPLNLNIADDAELLREFIAESREHLDNIEQGVLVLENQPKDAETMNTVFRAFHTFKGGAGFLNLLPINRLAHVLESLLDLARQDKVTIDAAIIELILHGRDVLKNFLDEIEGQINGTKPATPICIPTAALKADVQATIDQVNAGTYSTPDRAAAAAPAKAAPVSAPEALKPVSAPPAPVAESHPKAAPAAAAPTTEATAAKASELGAMVKVDTAKLDGLLDLVGEMVIAQSLVGQGLNGVPNLNPDFLRNMAQLGRITKDLQRVSMSLRMVPIRGVFQKMARVVRDLGAKQNKKVQFVTSGEDTELDRSVVEELNDPLLHMIRNSMDHGIESPEKRAAAGKPAMGTLSLRAYHQGGNIVVEIEDDGAGLNKDRILKKAIERGLTTASAQHTDEEIFSFIFAAGFSTAEVITDLSGRGVGLDVVRRNIEKLRGRVDISSTVGKGTLFKITLPLTLAIIDGLIIKIGEERYILPTLSVRESFRPEPGMITRIQGRAEVVKVRERLIPLLRMYDLFGITPKSTDATDNIIIVIQSGTKVRCLLVDGLLHKQEVVIKNLNDMMVHKNRSLAGAAILGDGRVGLILDVNALVHLESESFSKAA
ncbi:MAG TPA: chemotaxis protein CheA [Candidatus Paceibacterota bacterium]|nr:chemotaxis protein CheA [Candidatus Paceibacterota bacterium]